MIIGVRGFNDNRFFIQAEVDSQKLDRVLGINFLVDTGAMKTQLSWNDVWADGINPRSLRAGKTSAQGIGGTVSEYFLDSTTLSFNGLKGRITWKVGNLSVMDFKTIDNRDCPPMKSMLGMDFLHFFDILIEDNLVYLKRTY